MLVLLQGTFTPLAHAHAGRTPASPADKGREGSACFNVGDSIASLKRIIGPLPLTGEPLGRKPSIPVNEALTTRGKRHGKGKG